MKIITVVSVVAMVLLNAVGSRASVGGPLADLFLSLIIACAVGIYMAWSKRFGPAGRSLSIIAAMAGGLASLTLMGAVMEQVLSAFHFEGRFIESKWSNVVSAVGALMTLICAWAPIELGSRVLPRKAREA